MFFLVAIVGSSVALVGGTKSTKNGGVKRKVMIWPEKLYEAKTF